MNKKTILCGRQAAKCLFRLAGILLTATVCIFAAGMVSAKANRFDVSLKPKENAIEVLWKAKDSAVSYRIYRAELLDPQVYGTDVPAWKQYKKVKTVKRKNRTSWTDKTGVKGRYYAYVIRAYDKKGRKIADTYRKGTAVFACRGLGKPSLWNNGYGENHTNSEKVLYLYISPDENGMSSSGAQAVIFRKEAGEKTYKKIASVPVGEGSAEYADRTVKPGRTYLYRVQIVKKTGSGTCYSLKSDTVKIPAVRFRAKYKVRCLTPAETCTDWTALEITLILSNEGKYNGETIILPGGNEETSYTCSKLGNGGAYSYPFRFTHYSNDGSGWKKLPEKGIRLPSGSPLYLKGEISRGENESIFFGGNSKESVSLITSDSSLLDYQGPGFGETCMQLDLAAGTGWAYQEWD